MGTKWKNVSRGYLFTSLYEGALAAYLEREQEMGRGKNQGGKKDWQQEEWPLQRKEGGRLGKTWGENKKEKLRRTNILIIPRTSKGKAHDRKVVVGGLGSEKGFWRGNASLFRSPGRRVEHKAKRRRRS